MQLLFAKTVQFMRGLSPDVTKSVARLLDPSVYGTIALVTVFTTILQVFVDSGLGTSLIQKKDADDLDFSTVFFFNIGVCFFLYAIIFFAAPMIANFYNDIELIPIVRVLGLTIVISGVKNIQQSYVSKHLLFKKFFFATLAGTIGAAIIGIGMAYKGYGVWALVAQNLFNLTLDTIILWITVKWRPKKKFSFSRLKVLFSFGWKILASSLLNTVYNDLRSLIIGKIYSSSDLAYYNRGQQWPNLIVTNINTSIDSVLLPALSSEQDNKNRVRDMTRRAIKTSTYIMMPMMIGLAACADPLVRLILTEKWLPSVFFMRIFCITFAFYPIHTANLNAIKAMGRSDLFLKLEVIKKVFGLVALVSTMFISVKAMAYSLLAISVFSQVINSWPNKKLLSYSFIDQIKDIIPQILVSLMMGFIVFPVSLLNLNDFLLVAIQVVLGVIIYIALSKLMHLESYTYLKQVLVSRFQKESRG